MSVPIKPKRRADAHGKAQTAERAPALALGVLQNFFETQIQSFAGLRGGNLIQGLLCALQGRAPSCAAIPRFAQEGANSNEHRGEQAEQAEQHRPDKKGGDVMKQFAELVNGSHKI